MGTTIDYPVQNLDASRAKTLAEARAPKSSERSSDQHGSPNKTTEASDSQVRDPHMAHDPQDVVEIQNPHHQVIEANQASLKNTLKDVEEAQRLAQELLEVLGAEKDTSRVEQVHDFDQVSLLTLLS